MKYQTLLLPTALLAATTATVFALNLSHARSTSAPGAEGTTTVSALTPVLPQTDSKAPVPDEYLRPASLWPRLRESLRVLGDRLERPGKERLSMTGTLRRAGSASDVPFVLTREFPARLRLEEGQGAEHRVIVFDGHGTKRAARTRAEADDIETMAFDTAEHFFTAMVRGAAARHLGARFQLDDSSPENSSYDLYEITEEVDAGAGARQQTRIYGLNSDTMLPGVVQYETERDGSPLKVEVRLDDWRRVQGQMIPHRVERREGGRVTLTLDILTVVVSARVQDGAFASTPAR